MASANIVGFQEHPDLLHHMALQVSPSYLRSQDVPVYQLAQEPGTFIITFPKAFHGGFSYGYNIGEAVNFAISDWLKYGGEAGSTIIPPWQQCIHSYFAIFNCTFAQLNGIR